MGIMNNRAVFSSNSDEWATPQDIFDQLDSEFHFTLDPCATAENHKCDKYYTAAENGLEKSWGGEHVFLNPPYSQIGKWVAKAWKEGTKENTVVVMLIPSRTDTKYFHNYILHRSEIRFVQGRLRFSNAEMNAPFPSMIVIFRGANTAKGKENSR